VPSRGATSPNEPRPGVWVKLGIERPMRMAARCRVSPDSPSPTFCALQDNRGIGRRGRIRVRISSANGVEELTKRIEDRILTPWMPASA
jgi:hypothetical protein